MSLKKYADALVASKEENEKSLAPARAKEQAARVGIAVATLEVEVQGQQNELTELAGQYPLDIDAIVNAQDEIALNQRRLAQLKALSDELFGS